MNNLPAVYGYLRIEPDKFGDGVPVLVVPKGSGLPAVRVTMLSRAAHWVDQGPLLWLLGLPVMQPDELVILTAANLIHRGTAGAWSCGGRSDSGKDDIGTVVQVRAALAAQVDPEGKRHNTKACRTCFPKGLLVAPERQEEEEEGAQQA